MSKVFVSYRRDDSAGFAHAIYSELVRYLPAHQVLIDIDVDTVERIEEVVGQCEVLLALIGKQWATSQLDEPDDFVRLEVSAALAANIRVIPVLVDGTHMPYMDSLPPSLQPIVRRNAIEISSTRLKYDLDRLVSVVREILGETEARSNADREEETSRARQRRLQAEAQPKAEKKRLREEERQWYEEEAIQKADDEKERNRAQRRRQTMAYDVFISFKNLDEKGAPTRDAELANEVYNFLTSKGLSVFISTVTLESLGVSNYKKAIDEALESASIMVAVGTSQENLNSEWVRYEWDGFYNDILSGIKPSGKLFTYVAGLRPAHLPRALRQTQTFIHSSESLGQLHGFIVQALR